MATTGKATLVVSAVEQSQFFDSLVGTPSAAEALGVSPHRVRAIAMAMGVGRLIDGFYIFTADEVARMKNRPDGRRRSS